MKGEDRIQSLLEFLKNEPGDLFLNYALALEYQNDPATADAAEVQFRKVLAADGNYIAAYYHLGKLFESQQRIAEARDCYQTGLEKARLQKNRKSAAEFEEAIFMLEE